MSDASRMSLGAAEAAALSRHVARAAVLGDPGALRVALRGGGRARARGYGGFWMLHFACGAQEARRKGVFAAASGPTVFDDVLGRGECVAMLLAGGARWDDVDPSGRAALAWAASAGLSKACAALLDAGASVEARDNRGATALMAACSRHDGYMAGGVEDVLLSAGAQVDARDARGESALHKAVGNPGAAARLIAAGAVVDGVDRLGRSALHMAALANRASTMDLLLGAGANPLLADLKGRLPQDLGSGKSGRLAEAATEAARIQSHLGANPLTNPHLAKKPRL